jgi:uncharacterized protein YodC (DUF2158 family)
MSEAQKIKLFNIGDVVQLTSGGPHMTVYSVDSPETDEIKDLVIFVEWFDSTQHVNQHSFYSKQLIGV